MQGFETVSLPQAGRNWALAGEAFFGGEGNAWSGRRGSIRRSATLWLPERSCLHRWLPRPQQHKPGAERQSCASVNILDFHVDDPLAEGVCSFAHELDDRRR
jgi:hypothetical protein